MIQLVTFISAVMVLNAHAEPLRQRRQAEVTTTAAPSLPTLPFTMAVPCPVRCILGLSQAWTKALGFDVPTSTMVDDKVILGDSDTLGIMCSLYANYGNCLKACDASNDMNKAARDASPPYSQVCTDKLDDIHESSPCLSNNTKMFQSVCKSENENALAAAVRLATRTTLDRQVMDDYCSAANRQLYCLFPLIRQTCGDLPYDLIRSIANASHASVRVSMGGDAAIRAQYPECESYLETVDTGIPLGITTLGTTLAMTTIVNTTVANDTTTQYYTTTVVTTTSIDSTVASTTNADPLRRDDAGSDDDDTESRFGGSGAPRLQTTSQSSNASRRCLHFLAFVSFALIFGTFL